MRREIMSASNSSERVRTRAQRVATRVSYVGFQEKTRRLLYEDGGLIKIGLVLLTALLICLVCGVWNPSPDYRLYSTTQRDVVSRTSFKTYSSDLTYAARQEARARTLHYYVNDPAPIEEEKARLVTKMQELLATPDFSSCSKDSLEFLDGFLSKPIREDSASVAFEKLKTFFSDDVNLAGFKRSLDHIYAPFVEKGVLHQWGYDSAPLIGVGTSNGISTNEATRKIMVYDVGKKPATAREEDVATVLLGGAATGRRLVAKNFDDPDVVRLLAEKLKTSVPETLSKDNKTTREMQDFAESLVEDVYLSYDEGDLLLKAGTRIKPREYKILLQEHQAFVALRSWGQRLSSFFDVFVLIASLLFGAHALFYKKLIVNEVKPQRRSVRECLCFLASMFFFVLLGRIMQVELFSLGAAPEIVPMLVFVQLTALASTWDVALTFGVIVAFILSLSGSGNVDTFFVFVGSGVIVASASCNVRTRLQLIGVAFLSGVVSFLVSFAVGYAVNDRSFFYLESVSYGVWCLLAGFITSGILPVFERAFGILTPMRLLEYGNPSHPLLLELNRRAPATSSHSIQTAAIAETAAEAIGARASLVRVGAYFHDVGKMLQPDHFTENQKGRNIHDELEPRISALVIVAHVKDGVDLGKRYKLPSQIVDLIEQHHGTMLAGYFYQKAVKAAKALDPNAPTLDESPFRYPGPIPQTKEAGILMLADAAESASRSLTDWSPRKVEAMVQKLTEARIEDGQLTNSRLTLNEIQKIQQSMVTSLLASRHARVKYPDSDKTEKTPQKNSTKEEKEQLKDEGTKSESKIAEKEKDYFEQKDSSQCGAFKFKNYDDDSSVNI